MPPGSDMGLAGQQAAMWIALIVLAEFFLLALLGGFLLRVIAWEAAFQHSRDGWLAQLRSGAGQLRQLRRGLEKMPDSVQVPGLSPSLQRKWKVACWIARVLSKAKSG